VRVNGRAGERSGVEQLWYTDLLVSHQPIYYEHSNNIYSDQISKSISEYQEIYILDK